MLRYFVVGVLLVACYSPPPVARCELACSALEACPDGSRCLGDGFCHADGDSAADCDTVGPGVSGAA